MQHLRSESFDLYGRYSHVYRIRTESLPAAPIRILDVGDPFGTIASLFPDDETVSLDTRDAVLTSLRANPPRVDLLADDDSGFYVAPETLVAGEEDVVIARLDEVLRARDQRP